MRLRPRTLAPLYLVIGAALSGHGLAVAGLRLNLSPSLPLGLYRLAPTHIERGSVVAACLPRGAGRFGRSRGYLRRGSCPGGAAPVLKRVGAAAGDQVEITAAGIFVNTTHLQAPAPLADSQGRPLRPLPPARHAIGAGEVWLYSEHPDSWDSRFYGAVSLTSVLGCAHPLVVTRSGSGATSPDDQAHEDRDP